MCLNDVSVRAVSRAGASDRRRTSRTLVAAPFGKMPPVSAVLAAPSAADLATPPAPTPRLLMTRAEFEAAAEKTATRCEWLGYTDETRHGEPLGSVWPRYGFDSEGNYETATGTHSEIVTNVLRAL